jgi:hypothetical protein
MSQFYISNDDKNDAQRCRASRDNGQASTFTGLSIDGQVRPFYGIVELVDFEPSRGPGKHYLITIRDSKPPPSD